MVVTKGDIVGVKLDDVNPAGLEDHELVTVDVAVTTMSSIPILEYPLSEGPVNARETALNPGPTKPFKLIVICVQEP